jgi:hypothetical protein
MDDEEVGEGSGTAKAEGSKKGISAMSVFIDEKLIIKSTMVKMRRRRTKLMHPWRILPFQGMVSQLPSFFYSNAADH